MFKIKNPIRRGFYPDPSIIRVETDFYMVHSTFAYAPGIPVFHSLDLINWEQIGNVLERDTQLVLKNAKISEGIYAPTIRYHKGIYYVITTNVSYGGNFYVTASNPKGPWSDPIYLEDADGIDPSLYFERDTCYYIGQRNKKNGKYFGDCEIWIQELDLKRKQLIGKSYRIWDGAFKNAIWSEGPHIYKKDEYYYLLIAEGGTSYNHSICIARSKSLYGPYESCPYNPIFTHRNLGHDYEIQNVGHGDLVCTLDDEWYIVMLGTRPLNGCAELGRETFLAKVDWEEEWPIINKGVGKIESFEMQDKREIQLHLEWTVPLNKSLIGIRKNPIKFGEFIKEGKISLPILPNTLSDLEVPAFIGTRILSRTFEVETKVLFCPEQEEEAGLVYFYNEQNYVRLVITNVLGKYYALVFKMEGGKEQELACSIVSNEKNSLLIKGKDQLLLFEVNEEEILKDIDVKFLSTEMAGGFVGCTVGIYATAHHKESMNKAIFEPLDLKFYNL